MFRVKDVGVGLKAWNKYVLPIMIYAEETEIISRKNIDKQRVVGRSILKNYKKGEEK